MLKGIENVNQRWGELKGEYPLIISSDEALLFRVLTDLTDDIENHIAVLTMGSQNKNVVSLFRELAKAYLS
ncbi:MAG: hypothetical protein A2646_02680 [Candidatus Portnoybacteria bacterium RIFCSPHIGHO2_02_FULL_39_12]|uniref:Uncharacterized protein n=1 Tax=Candidatus Portnoybacteria bacterium RIFCSPHIGHO2_12_FULL_38_9 TaxID=1801997 RepID=A0A1G2FHK4_9BACT|nr:MAG: hypothetical protein A3H00_01665 [Candidatus Portnoybacteria bacterium RBG_13_40_8]OGZ36099.1 MAG: hypothetical protein A2646_02680 [Candidatus Portnoybacteria bacterium RIFCSPHIGHO2_02_FULL_39_12]OGZ37545.1 MAG: hypothetical protein A3J64_01550 [Candidatus Portnoybacteria bacterium RIFCSPHIGHO2_12_FULL_38_9]OGZ39423.1 MAG: hypothetical protein A3F21_02895 [Candidatus Portnoybacteria bacterium RIFCSPLOWO2_01_FULL_38_39]